MKQCPQRSLGKQAPLAAALLALLLSAAARADVTFTITPSVVSNTYSGSITLQVSGVTNGETVVVQKFLDVNANDVVDAGDWLVQQFNLTKGQPGMVIGGVTNLNVPGDVDASTNQITAKFKFASGDFMQNIVGSYAFEVSSPGGHFATLTNFFTVTNVPYGQSLGGTVFTNGTAAPAPYAIVLVFPPSRPGKIGPAGSPVAGGVTDASGRYQVQLPAGAYTPAAFKKGCVTDFSTVPEVALGAGQTITTNLTLTGATSSISGSLVDSITPTTGLPGILLSAQTPTGLLGVTATDPNGNFTVGTLSSPAQWYLGPNDTSLIVHGYLGLQGKTGFSPGQTGATLTVPRATALFYGTVKDSLGNAMTGIDVYASDDGFEYETDCHTDSKGNYFAVALAGGWGVQISTDNSPANYIFSGNLDLTLANGEAAPWNFTAILATNQISGSLKDNYGHAIPNVGVWGNAQINGVYYNQGNSQTDSSGNYSLSVANGTWSVGINAGGGDNSLPANYICSANQSVVIANNNATANFTALIATNQITGFVSQFNGNPIAGVGVWGSAVIGGVTYSVETGTDGTGNYTLSVADAIWNVGLLCNGGGGNWSTLDNLLGPGTYQCPGSQMVDLLTGNPVADFTVEPLQPLQMSNTPLPAATVGQFYSQQISASGGQQPYSWWLPGGLVSLPPTASGDMDFSSSGPSATISGVPSLPGTYPFWVGVYDSAFPQNVVTQMFSITVQSVSSPLVVGVNILAPANLGVFYSQTLAASGGVPPYRWSIPDYSTAPPANLVLSTNGVLSGTPAAAGTFYFYVRVTDAVTNSADSPVPLTLNVTSALQITNLSLPNGTVGGPYSAQLGATGGQPLYSWSLALGSAGLPAGLGLSASGLISGKPTSPGRSTFRVQATDADLATASQTFSITINPQPTLGSPAWRGHQFVMRLTGAAGQNYAVQMATSLIASNWTTLFFTNNPATNSFNVIDPAAADRQRFYRVEVGP